MWKIVGLILGPKLPNQKLKIGNCTIKKINRQRAEDLFKIRTQSSLNITGKNITVIFPVKKTVQSLHEFSIKIDASTKSDAVQKTQHELDLILPILSLPIGGMRYHAIIKQAIPLNIKTPNVAIPLKGINVSLYPSDNISEEEYKKCLNHYSLLEDSTFKKCINLLSSAWKLLDAKSSGPIEKPLLQTYFKILEGISNKITSDGKKDQKEELIENQSDLILDFINSNKGEENKNKLLEDFRETYNEFSRLENQYLSLKIEHTGKKLNINQETINDAIEFNKLRNKFLSHFRSTEKKIDSKWLENVTPTQPNKAEMICRTYMKAYADYISQ